MENTENQKRNLVLEFKQKAKKYIKSNPKNVFVAMLTFTILSIIGNYFYYTYVVSNAKVTYNKMNEEIFKKQDNNFKYSKENGITEQTGDYLQMKKDLDKLKDFQKKEKLSKNDTLEILRIVKKYNLR